MNTFWHGRARSRTGVVQGFNHVLVGLAAVIGLVAAGCGSAKPATVAPKTPSASPTTASSPLPASPSPSPSLVTASPSAHATPARSPSPSHAATNPTPTRAASPSPAASAAASTGRIALPAAGTYSYALTGSYQTPLAVGAQPYPAGSTLSTAFAVSGTQVMATVSSAQDNSSSSTTWTYGPAAVVITASNLTYAGLASYDCSYTPPPTALPNPLQAGTLPTASWSSANCSGDVSVDVVDNETVSAAGASWNVWKVQTTLHYQAQSSVNVTATSTVLFSAQAGVPITSDTTTTGTVAGQPFSDHQVATLTSHP